MGNITNKQLFLLIHITKLLTVLQSKGSIIFPDLQLGDMLRVLLNRNSVF